MKIDKKSVKENSSANLDREMALGISPALNDKELEALTQELEMTKQLLLKKLKKEAINYFRKKKTSASSRL